MNDDGGDEQGKGCVTGDMPRCVARSHPRRAVCRIGLYYTSLLGNVMLYVNPHRSRLAFS